MFVRSFIDGRHRYLIGTTTRQRYAFRRHRRSIGPGFVFICFELSKYPTTDEIPKRADGAVRGCRSEEREERKYAIAPVPVFGRREFRRHFATSTLRFMSSLCLNNIRLQTGHQTVRNNVAAGWNGNRVGSGRVLVVHSWSRWPYGGGTMAKSTSRAGRRTGTF
jgi:hypothetical protein